MRSDRFGPLPHTQARAHGFADPLFDLPHGRIRVCDPALAALVFVPRPPCVLVGPPRRSKVRPSDPSCWHLSGPDPWACFFVVWSLPSNSLADSPDDQPPPEAVAALSSSVLVRFSSPPSTLPRFLTSADDGDNLPTDPGAHGISGLRVMDLGTAPALGVHPLHIAEAWEAAATQVRQRGKAEPPRPLNLPDAPVRPRPRLLLTSLFLALPCQVLGLGAAPVVAVCGAKGVGKSTCARYLVHRLLSRPGSPGRVAFLDCDVGQPELTPPGLVSLFVVSTPLLGPPHTHLQTPLHSYFLGETSPKSEPGLYTSYVGKRGARTCSSPRHGHRHLTGGGPKTARLCRTDAVFFPRAVRGPTERLVTAYRADASLSCLPLVVNMDGWVRGLGMELLDAVLGLLQPHAVLQLQGQQRSDSRG